MMPAPFIVENATSRCGSSGVEFKGKKPLKPVRAFVSAAFLKQYHRHVWDSTPVVHCKWMVLLFEPIENLHGKISGVFELVTFIASTCHLGNLMSSLSLMCSCATLHVHVLSASGSGRKIL